MRGEEDLAIYSGNDLCKPNVRRRDVMIMIDHQGYVVMICGYRMCDEETS